MSTSVLISRGEGSRVRLVKQRLNEAGVWEDHPAADAGEVVLPLVNDYATVILTVGVRYIVSETS